MADNDVAALRATLAEVIRQNTALQTQVADVRADLQTQVASLSTQVADLRRSLNEVRLQVAVGGLANNGAFVAGAGAGAGAGAAAAAAAAAGGQAPAIHPPAPAAPAIPAAGPAHVDLNRVNAVAAQAQEECGACSRILYDVNGTDRAGYEDMTSFATVASETLADIRELETHDTALRTLLRSVQDAAPAAAAGASVEVTLARSFARELLKEARTKLVDTGDAVSKALSSLRHKVDRIHARQQLMDTVTAVVHQAPGIAGRLRDHRERPAGAPTRLSESETFMNGMKTAMETASARKVVDTGTARNIVRVDVSKTAMTLGAPGAVEEAGPVAVVCGHTDKKLNLIDLVTGRTREIAIATASANTCTPMTPGSAINDG